MNLLEKACEISQRPEIFGRDLAWKHNVTVEKRIGSVCRHVANLFEVAPGKKATPTQVAMEPLSGGDLFSSQNPADVALLIFEVIAERNRNPQLWDVPGLGGIDAEINNTIRTFLLGPNPLAGHPLEGVHESTYSGAKKTLLEKLDTKLPF